MKVDQMLALLQRNDPQCHTSDFCTNVIAIFNGAEASKKTLSLLQMLISKFGFAVALFALPLYQRLAQKIHNRLGKELAIIEHQVENCLTPYGLQSFPELQFLISKNKKARRPNWKQLEVMCLNIEGGFAATIKELSQLEGSLMSGLR